MATLLDLFFHQLVATHRRQTFNPEEWAEHRELARQAKRNRQPPPDIPTVTPVALRPAGWPSLTEQLTPPPPEDEVEEVFGHEAHERLQALLNS